MLDNLIKPGLVSASGLSIFRIGFFTVQLFELLQIMFMKELIFDPLPLIHVYHPSHDQFLIGWFVCLLFIIFGFKTRYALVANCAFTLMFFSLSDQFEYHMDYVYTMINFASMFLPLGPSYSIDALFDKRKEVLKVADAHWRKGQFQIIRVKGQ